MPPVKIAFTVDGKETRDGVPLTNLDQPLFEGSDATKRDLIDYLDSVRDRIIPAHHAQATHEAVPGSRLVVFDGAGHFPHADDPDRFTTVVEDFIASTEPAAYDKARTRTRMTTR